MTCPRWDTLRFNHMEEGAVKLVKQQLWSSLTLVQKWLLLSFSQQLLSWS
jgi:hypothetical protein